MSYSSPVQSDVSAWPLVPLSELVDADRGISYGIVQPGPHVSDGVPMLRVNNLKNGYIVTDDVMRVAPEIEARYDRTRLRGGEVLLSLVGSLGLCAVVPSELIGWNVARAVGVIPVHKDIGAEWVKYCLQSTAAQHFVNTRATTTVQATFNLRDVNQIPIPIPTVGERNHIVQILSSLDEKIELNRRMNQTLEAMARAIFKSWFIDFDPVHHKAAGRTPPGLDPATATLFPAAFQDSSLGPIPGGWEERSLDQIANYLNGLALQRFPPGDGPTLPVIKIAQLRKGDTVGADHCNTDVPSEYVVQDGDVLFSWSGTLEVELWCGGAGALNQHLFKVTSSEFPKWFYYLWTRRHLDDFRRIAAGKATTMGHIQRGHLNSAKVLIPSEQLLNAMTPIIAPLLDRIIANRIESRTLAVTRDTLLPEFISGNISISEAQYLV